MFESYAKPALIKAGPEPVPQPGILNTPIPAGGGTGRETERLQAAIAPGPGFGPGILTFAQQLADEERRRHAQAAAGNAGWPSAIMRLPGRPSSIPPGPATQPGPGTPGYNPAWNGLAPGMPQPVQHFAPTDPAYGYQDYMAVRNSAGQ